MSWRSSDITVTANIYASVYEDAAHAAVEAVTALMQQHNASLMIHGHTHRPAIHELPFSLTDGHSGQQQQAQRIVLGDWDTHLSVLEADENGVTLQRYPLGE